MMTCQPFARPALRPERHLLAPSLWQSTLAIGYALLLFAGPLALFVAASEWFGWWALAALPLLLPAGYGLFLQGILGHEGFHFNLSSNRLLSCLLAVGTSSLLCGFCVTGYFVDHWQHHRYSNSPRDPDWRLLALLIAALNAYQEHAFPADIRQPLARSRTALLSTLLHLGSNYHLEHHLYPRVPCWRLHHVHRALLASGWYDGREALLEPSFLGALRYCRARFPYAGA